jgi:hypothetical protein
MLQNQQISEEVFESRGRDKRCKQEFIQNIRRREDNMRTINNLWVQEK